MNPWAQLPMHGDFVLPADVAPLEAFNRTVAPDAQFDLSLYPEPYFGRPDAPVVLLALNPGRGAYFADSDHLFRPKSISRFGPSRSPSSVDVDQG